MTFIVMLTIFAVLFFLAFLTKRRFGILGLGLSAGALLATVMTQDVAVLFSNHAVPVSPLSSSAAASISLTLLPALILLLSGPAYKKRSHAIVGASLFAAMGLLLILGPLTTSLSVNDISLKIFLEWLARSQGLVLAVMVGLSLLDALAMHVRHHIHDDKKKKA